MEKVIDPYSEPFPYTHITPFRKLGSVLKNGLVAENFARRAKIDEFTRRYKSSWNDRYVSLSQHSIKLCVWPYVTILVRPNEDVIQGREVKARTTDVFEPDWELLVKNRISPKEFIGIVIGDRSPDNPDVVSLEDYYNYDPKDWRKASVRIPAEAILDTMEKSGISLPVYKGSEGLVWPVRMTPEELGERYKVK